MNKPSSSDFDPYYEWLGIPPEHQPPNLYRLLGIELFESTPNVIDAAANRISSYLQDLASGPHRDHSQRILNEVAKARRLLLDPQRKRQYDQQLKSRRTNEQAQNAPKDAATDPTVSPSLPDIKAHNTTAGRTADAARKNNRLVIAIAAGGAACAITIAVAFVAAIMSDNLSDSPNPPAPTNSTATIASTPQPAPRELPSLPPDEANQTAHSARVLANNEPEETDSAFKNLDVPFVSAADKADNASAAITDPDLSTSLETPDNEAQSSVADSTIDSNPTIDLPESQGDQEVSPTVPTTEVETTFYKPNLDPAVFEIGVVRREVWKLRDTTSLNELVNQIRSETRPDDVDQQASIGTVVDPKYHFGQRFSAYLTPPLSGEYTFDVDIELKSDSDSGDFVLLQYQPTANAAWIEIASRIDDKPNSIKLHSLPIHLQGGQSYPLQLLHQERTGDQFVHVFWTQPGSSEKLEIESAYYSQKPLPTFESSFLPIPVSDAKGSTGSEFSIDSTSHMITAHSEDQRGETYELRIDAPIREVSAFQIRAEWNGESGPGRGPRDAFAIRDITIFTQTKEGDPEPLLLESTAIIEFPFRDTTRTNKNSSIVDGKESSQWRISRPIKERKYSATMILQEPVQYQPGLKYFVNIQQGETLRHLRLLATSMPKAQLLNK